jgi:hypothetical protein
MPVVPPGVARRALGVVARRALSEVARREAGSGGDLSPPGAQRAPPVLRPTARSLGLATRPPGTERRRDRDAAHEEDDAGDDERRRHAPTPAATAPIVGPMIPAT